MISPEPEGLYNEDQFEVKLDTIPDELFLHICSFLPSKYLISVISQVCLKFKNILEDNATWKIRLRDRFPNQHLILDYADADWAKICIDREEQYRLWCNKETSLVNLHIQNAHFASVDVVHIIDNGNICASGSRDRDIKLWNLKAVQENGAIDSDSYSSLVLRNVIAAHEGWIWSMAYSSHFRKLYSGSWDGFIKGWDIEQMVTLGEFISFRVKSPSLCLAFCGEMLACGSYNGVVNVFDERTGTQPAFKYTKHRKPVLCLAANEKYIISGGEDHSLLIFDTVARKVHKELKFDSTYPFSLSLGAYHLWMGDNKGNIHLIDSYYESFNLLESYSSGHGNGVTGIHHSLGSIITCSSDKTIRVLAPCANPQTITTMSCNGEVAGISAFSDTLVSANSDDSISIWVPKICNEV